MCHAQQIYVPDSYYRLFVVNIRANVHTIIEFVEENKNCVWANSFFLNVFTLKRVRYLYAILNLKLTKYLRLEE